MPVVSTLGAMSSRGFGEFNQQAAGQYIEDYFSTYLYTGNGSTQTISNGIALANTAGWSNLYSTIVSGTTNTVFANANGVYYAGKASGNKSNVLAVNQSNGATIFNRNLTGSGGNDYYFGITGDSSGNIICVGRIGNGFNISIVKYDSTGALQWQRQIAGGANTAAGICVACDSSGNIYVGGQYTTSYARGLVAKYNSSGTLQWQRFIYDTAATTGTYLNSIVVGSAGDVYICGKSYDAGTYTYAYVAKIDTSGTFQWSRLLRVNFNDSFDAISLDSSDNVYAFGNFNQSSALYGIVAKYNSSGTLQWQTRPTTNVSIYGGAADSSGNVYVNVANLGLVKLNTSGGSILWQNTINPSSGSFYGITLYGSNVYASCLTNSNTTTETAILPTDGSATSGAAGSLVLYGASYAITSSTATSSSATVAVTTSTLTESALSQTDSAGSNTSTIYKQAAVTGAGGLVWMKSRSQATQHLLLDTVRGFSNGNLNVLNSASANAASNDGPGSTSVIQNGTASGFVLGTGSGFAASNQSTQTYASWTFRKQPKFFDIVTYTGNGSVNRQINHNLGSVPGMIIVKCTSTGATNWPVYHRGLNNGVNPQNFAIYLNLTNDGTGGGRWAGTAPTATQFSVNNDNSVNTNGDTYVAYLFAHNAGGFGADGSQNVISCGSFNGPVTQVNLGWEPQWLLIKRTGGVQDWYVLDNMRGIGASGNYNYLLPNTSGAEGVGSSGPTINATGFTWPFGGGTDYIYVAIRRGPMRTPTSGTSVFSPIASSAATGTALTTNFVIDSQWSAVRTGNALNTAVSDRLRGVSTTTTGSGNVYLTSATDAEGVNTAQATQYWNNTGFQMPLYFGSSSDIFWSFSRAPGFMDVVCYTGTGANRTVSHNLGVVPELMIIKSRSATGSWITYFASLGNTQILQINATAAASASTTVWNSTTPTSSVFTVGTSTTVNNSGDTFAAYLFATLAGVSKVGSYSGTGATQTINCGFTGGARFVLIKRADGVASWWVWDTARGMVAGTDPRLALNNTNAEANANWVYTTTGGFQIVTSDTAINASGGTYIYLAIA